MCVASTFTRRPYYNFAINTYWMDAFVQRLEASVTWRVEYAVSVRASDWFAS